MRHETPTALRIQKARTSLILDHPFFGSLLFRLKGRECAAGTSNSHGQTDTGNSSRRRWAAIPHEIASPSGRLAEPSSRALLYLVPRFAQRLIQRLKYCLNTRRESAYGAVFALREVASINIRLSKADNLDPVPGRCQPRTIGCFMSRWVTL